MSSHSGPTADSRLNPARVFATTHWSIVLNASGGSEEAGVALGRLCATYWYPLYAHVRKKGHSPADAEDLTQEFFASLIRHDSLSRIRRERGRFRTFLLTSLNYFLCDHADKRNAQKRGSGQKVVEWDALAAEQQFALEPSTDETPDKAFDRRWAAALVSRALDRLQQEYMEARKTELFESLKPFLSRETIPGEYDELAARAGITVNGVAAAVKRMRGRLRELALAEAAQTVATPDEAEEEFRALWR